MQKSRKSRLEAMADAYESPHEAATAQRILHGAAAPIDWMQEVHKTQQYRKVAPPCPACGHGHIMSAICYECGPKPFVVCTHCIIGGQWRNFREYMTERFGAGAYHWGGGTDATKG